MKYCVIVETLNQMIQHFSKPTIKYFNTKEEAEVEFGDNCIHLINQGFNIIYQDINEEDNFIEKRFSNGYFTVTLVLSSEEEEK